MRFNEFANELLNEVLAPPTAPRQELRTGAKVIMPMGPKGKPEEETVDQIDKNQITLKKTKPIVGTPTKVTYTIPDFEALTGSGKQGQVGATGPNLNKPGAAQILGTSISNAITPIGSK